MNARSIALAAAAAAVCAGAPAGAQQTAAPKLEQPKPAAVTLKPADVEVQLAERSDAKAPAVVSKRPRAARVTSCRCGDPASQQ